MLFFAANISTSFTEERFVHRFKAAGSMGFSGIEIDFPYDEPAEFIAEKLTEFKLKLINFNAPAGDWDKGERGLAALTSEKGRFQDSIGEGLEYAEILGCDRMNILAGIAEAHTGTETYLENISYAAKEAKKHGVTVLIEPKNHKDYPGYFLKNIGQAFQFTSDLKIGNLKILLNFYHRQISRGGLTQSIQMAGEHVGYIKIADAPGGHEPGTGEINYLYVFDQLMESNYKDWIGCSFTPSAHSDTAFGWLEQASYPLIARNYENS